MPLLRDPQAVHAQPPTHNPTRYSEHKLAAACIALSSHPSRLIAISIGQSSAAASSSHTHSPASRGEIFGGGALDVAGACFALRIAFALLDDDRVGTICGQGDLLGVVAGRGLPQRDAPRAAIRQRD